MAKIIIAGNSMIVKSAVTLETLKTLEKYRPKALALYGENGKEEIFRVCTTTGKGIINAFSASFGASEMNDSKKAIITMEIPSDTKDAKVYAENTIGVAIVYLNKVEEQFVAALAEIDKDRQAVRENISIV